MNSVIILNRKGIQVAGGEVAEVSVEGEMAIIQNSSGTQKIALQYDEDMRKRMAIKAGDKVVATIRPNVTTLAMAAGEDVDNIPVMKPLILRYTGSFDFEQRGDIPEQHVFCGDIAEVAEAGDGLLIKIQWRRKHEAETRCIYYGKPGKKEQLEQFIGKQVVMVTGGIVRIGDADAYRFDKIGIF